MPVYEVAILARAKWNLHSLSNEGTVGNVTEPRTLVLADGRQTDGISGEMLKHIHAECIWALEDNKRNFCQVCREVRPERADGNPNIRRQRIAPNEAVRIALQDCVLCDLHGFLVQEPNVSRESTTEFGWAVGVGKVERHIHTQARHEKGIRVIEEKDKNQWGGERCRQQNCNIKPQDSKLYKVVEEGEERWYCGEHIPAGVQMPYHRPTRSGRYGIVSVFQPWRIGLNNVNFRYEIDDTQRKRRYDLVIKAYQAMFLRPEGAMTSTRLPHTEGFEGVIVVAKSNFPVPVISPLKDDYVEQIEQIKDNIGDSVELKKFDSLSKFVEELKKLLQEKPYKVSF